MDMVVTSSSPSAMAQGLAMADLIIHLGFTRCYFLKEAARDVSMNFAYLEGIRRRAVKDNRLEVLDREVTLDELLIARALTDIKMLGTSAMAVSVLQRFSHWKLLYRHWCNCTCDWHKL